jgi:AcrR family transcriptional regulator
MLLDHAQITATDGAPMRRGERRKQHTKRRLLDAAAETYALMGVEGATISSITERADVGLGTFYLHFEDKDTIAASVSAIVVRALLAGESELTAERAARGEVVDRLVSLARVIVDEAAKTPGLFCALLTWEGSRSAAAFVHPTMRDLLTPELAARIGRGVESGAYRIEDSTITAHAILGVLSSCLPAWVATGRKDWDTLGGFVERSVAGMVAPTFVPNA